MSIDRLSDREVVVHIYNEILLSHRKEHIWVSSNEGDEPRAYYTEWSQRKKNKYHILMHTCGISKDGADEPIRRAAVEMQTQRMDLWTPWEKERVGWLERGALKHILPYVKHIASGNLFYDTGSSNLVLCDNPKEWDGVRDRREMHKGGYIRIPMADSCWAMA